MNQKEFYSEFAKKTGMNEPDSKYFWNQCVEFVTDTVISKCYRDGGKLELPGLGTVRAERITSHLPRAGKVQSTRLYFNRSNEFRDKVSAFRESQRNVKAQATRSGSDIAAFAAAIEKNPELAATLRSLIAVLDSAQNPA